MKKQEGEISFNSSRKIKNPIVIGLLLCISIICGIAITKFGMLSAIVLILLPAICYIGYIFFINPIYSLKAAIIYPFILAAIFRYMAYYLRGTKPPIGLLFLFLILFAIISTFLTKWDKINWKFAFNSYSILQVIWLVYGILQFFNPEAASRDAWIYGIRATISDVLFIIVGMLLLSEKKHMYFFLKVWFVISIISALKCVMQQYVGVDNAERFWLNSGAAKTHILFGKLRGFGIYTDAGQFGAAMGHTLVSSIILAIRNGISFKQKILFLSIAFLTFIAMMLSGTRGAFFVPISGIALFLILNKKIKIIILGLFLLGGVFYFLKYTAIAQGNYHVRRMRTALDPNDASFQVRLKNQKLLKTYLASRPFGGGIGACGSLGGRFSPNTFLGQFPPDSHYVMIWANYGIVGLLLHISILLFYFTKGCLVYFKTKDPELKQIVLGLLCGMYGIYVCSYGNEVLGGKPTYVVIFITWIIFYHTPRWDKEISNANQ